MKPDLLSAAQALCLKIRRVWDDPKAQLGRAYYGMPLSSPYDEQLKNLEVAIDDVCRAKPAPDAEPHQPEACACCKYYKQRPDCDSGRCRKLPPTAMQSDWPMVNATDWCGEFSRAAEQKAI